MNVIGVYDNIRLKFLTKSETVMKKVGKKLLHKSGITISNGFKFILIFSCFRGKYYSYMLHVGKNIYVFALYI